MFAGFFCKAGDLAAGHHPHVVPTAVESLEARTLCSASHLVDLHLGTYVVPQESAVVRHGHKPHVVTSAVKAAVSPNYVGFWSGTYQINGRDGTKTLGVNFTKQKGVAVTGRFDLSGMVGASNVLTTVTIDKSRRFLALISVGKATVSFSGSADGGYSMLFGRFCVRGANGSWTTGVFSMQRQPG